MLELIDGWNSFLGDGVMPPPGAPAEGLQRDLQTTVLPAFLRRQRWYAAGPAALERVTLHDRALLHGVGDEWLLGIVDARTAVGSARYFLPLAIAFGSAEDDRWRALEPLALARVRAGGRAGLLADATGDEPFCRALLRLIGDGAELQTARGRIHGVPGTRFTAPAAGALDAPLAFRRLATSSNSVCLLGDRLFLKFYRQVNPGRSLELEVGRFLTDGVAFAHCVPVLGHVEYRGDDGQECTLALLQARIDNQGDAWTLVVDAMTRLLEAGASGTTGTTGTTGVDAQIEAIARRLDRLARCVADLHLAFARRTGDPAFDPEPMQPGDARCWSDAVCDELAQSLATLQQRQNILSQSQRALADRVMAAREALHDRVAQAASTGVAGPKTRIHGDLHLQQVLVCGDDFVLIDFEGEPRRTLAERRAKHSAWRDVAGMLRSFDYARAAALDAAGGAKQPRLAALARRCERRIRDRFLATYRETALAGLLYRPEQAGAAARLLDLFELEKALYELRYEFDHRPGMLDIPLAGIAALAEAIA